MFETIVASFVRIFFAAECGCLTCLLLLSRTSFGRLIITPQNIVPWSFSGAANNVSMNCSSSYGSAGISWNFTSFNTTDEVTVAVGSRINSMYSLWFFIDQPTRDDSNLLISQTANNNNNFTAGTYRCFDIESSASAQLVAPYSWGYQTNASPAGVIIGKFSVSFWVGYFGNRYISPTFALVDKDYVTIYSVAAMFTNSSITSMTNTSGIFTGVAVCGRNFTISSYISYFDQINWPLPSDSATNNGTHYGVPILPIVSVFCNPTESDVTISGADSNGVIFPGMELTCHLVSDTAVEYYSWTDLTFGNFSNGSSIRIWHSGSYRCEAYVYVDGVLYSASKTLYNLTVASPLARADPSHGPVAGGTNITILIDLWSRQATSISAIYLGTDFELSIISTDRSKNQVIATTPNTTNEFAGQRFPLIVEFLPGPVNITTTNSFLYLWNPEIYGLDPQQFVATGGILLTVYGSNLSSIAYPLIHARLIVQRGNQTVTDETTSEPCTVNSTDGNQAFCKMPPLNIPPDFLQILDSQFNGTVDRQKARSALAVTGPNGTDEVSVYLGFTLDGYGKYSNINDALPYTQIFYYSPPEIDGSDQVISYDAETKEVLKIKGKYMTRGCRENDYVVHVGNGICKNVQLTDNQLTCRLPDTEPQSTRNDTSCGQSLRIEVFVGFKEYRYACLKYTYPRILKLIIGICVGVGGFLLLTFIVIGIICCCRRNKPKLEVMEEANNPSEITYSTTTFSDRDSHDYDRSIRRDEY